MEEYIIIAQNLFFYTVFMLVLDMIFGKILRIGFTLKDHLSLSRVTLFTCLSGLHIIITNKGFSFGMITVVVLIFIAFYNLFLHPILKKI